MDDRRERSLIRRVKRRQDKRAADELIHKYYKEIYVYVYRQIAEREQSMDITQEIFLGMLKTLWSYDEKKSNFRTWLYRIATYKVVDFFRSRDYTARGEIIPINMELAQDFDLEHEVTDRQLVREIFLFLRERDRMLEELFRLKFFSEYTFAQIGQILELPESTVKTKYYAALKLIRERFSK